MSEWIDNPTDRPPTPPSSGDWSLGMVGAASVFGGLLAAGLMFVFFPPSTVELPPGVVKPSPTSFTSVPRPAHPPTVYTPPGYTPPGTGSPAR